MWLVLLVTPQKKLFALLMQEMYSFIKCTTS